MSGIERACRKLQKDSGAVFSAVEQRAGKMEDKLSRVGSGVGTKGVENIVKFERATKGATAQTGNLAAQINDIGVQLAGGQSPFLIAIQPASVGVRVWVKSWGGVSSHVSWKTQHTRQYPRTWLETRHSAHSRRPMNGPTTTPSEH